MENRILLKANLKQQKGGMLGIFLLMLLAAAALGTVLTVWLNAGAYVKSEMRRAGFGDLTAWVSGVPKDLELAKSIEHLPEIERVETQSLVFTNYTANGQESDSEGQLILYQPAETRYRFFKDDLSGYKEQPKEIAQGGVYVSPSMVSMFGVRIGDEITFPIARAGGDLTLTVEGFYEDPFMGSSMIGMKGFLICEADRREILSILQNAGIDALARDGAMLHIFSSSEGFSVSELNGTIHENTALAEYAEFVHGKDAIAGFLLVLQNAFGGLLLAFVLVLLLVVLAALGHSISSAVETDTANMAILKTIGFSADKLRLLWLIQYLAGIIGGMACGLFLAVPVSSFVSSMTLTSTGIRIPAGLPLVWILLSFAAILLLLIGFIWMRTVKIGTIAPIQAIRGGTKKVQFQPQRAVCVIGTGMYFRLALRQLMTGKRRYIGTFAVAAFLVFFASLTGRMDTWLGADGKGMMDAFNPADHDIGVQVFGNLNAEEAEAMVRAYTDITDVYLLAMPGVAVNGVDYTANVISEPGRFHILEGKTCTKEDEIVLTEFAAADFGVSIGDTVTVQGDMGSGSYMVSGIYSCANDMGDNVGMSREGYLKIGSDNPHIWCWHYFLADPSGKSAIAEALEDAYGGDVHVHENTWPGLSGIILAMRALMVVMYGMTAVFILIVTMMAGSRILSLEQKDLGIYRAVGFPSGRLRLAFALRFGMTAVAGSAVGTMLAAFLTDPLVSAVMKMAGISSFASAPSMESVLLPSGVVILLFFCFAYLVAGRMEKTDLSVLTAE